MNKTYRTIWNAALDAWVAVSELCTQHGAGSAGRRGLLRAARRAAMSGVALASLGLLAPPAMAQNQPNGTFALNTGDVISIIGNRENKSTGSYPATQVPGVYIFKSDGAEMNFRGGYYRNTGRIEVDAGVTGLITGGGGDASPNILTAPEKSAANVLLYNPAGQQYQIVLRDNSTLEIALRDSSDHFGKNYLMFTNNGNYANNGSNYYFGDNAHVKVTSGGFRLDPYTHDTFNLSRIIFNGGYFSTQDGDDTVYADENGQAIGYVMLGKGEDHFIVNPGVNIVGQDKGNSVRMYETATGDDRTAHLVGSEYDGDGKQHDNPNDVVELRPGSSATGINFDFGKFHDVMTVQDGARLVDGTVLMRDGNDTFTAGADPSGAYAVTLGEGAYIDMGNGDDTFNLNGSTLRGTGTASAAAVRMGAGNDTVNLADATVIGVAGRTTFDLGAGNDTVNLTGTTLEGATGANAVDFGAGNDTMHVTRSTLNGATVAMNSGNNTVNVNANADGATTTLDGNVAFTRSGTAGSNVLNVTDGATLALDDGASLDFAGTPDVNAGGTLAGTGTTSVNAATGMRINGTVQVGAADADGTMTLANATANGIDARDGARLTGGGTLASNGIRLSGTVHGDVADGRTLTHSGVFSGAGHLDKDGAGTLRVDGANTYSGGTSVKAGTLTLGHVDGAGTGTIDTFVDTATRLAFSGTAGTFDATFDNDVTGTGMVRVEGTDIDIAGDNSGFTGDWIVLADGSVRVKAAQHLGGAPVDLAGRLDVTPDSGGFTFDNALRGTGTLATQMGATADAFAFGAGTGDQFRGTVEMGRGTFGLSGDNTAALTRATLNLNTDSTTTVGNGEQVIEAIGIHGGTVIFDATAPDATRAASTIRAARLDAGDTGTVRITVPDPYVPSAPGTPYTANLLEQDDGNIGVQLIAAQTVNGSGGALVLQDQNAADLGPQRILDVAQDGNIVAKGLYEFRLTTAPGDGLYVNYGLHQVDLQDGQTLTLAQAPGATGAAADMSAQVTGSGHLAVDAGTGAVSLSNVTNDYTGETSVRSGTLRLASDHALGDTSALNLPAHTSAELAGYRQDIGALHADAGSTLDWQGGELSIANGGHADGTLRGGGRLDVDGGTLAVSGANPGLSVRTAIADGATVTLAQANGLGTGAIADAGELALQGAVGALANDVSGAGTVSLQQAADIAATGDNSGFAGTFRLDPATTLTVSQARHLGTATVEDSGTLRVVTDNDWTLANPVQGSGALVKDGAATLIVGDAVQHAGTTDVLAGTLLVGDADHPGRTLGAPGADVVTVADGATLGGLGTVSGRVDNHGQVAVLNALPGYGNAGNGTFTLAGGMQNAGVVTLAGPAGSTPGNVLVVRKGYAGDGGRLVLRTVMGGDDSPTDRLVLEGGEATGRTGVVVRSAGGGGAQTDRGIRVVETRDGATTGADAFHLDPASDGYRRGAGSLAVGAYDYQLARGGNGGTADDWYLLSQREPEPPVPPKPPVPPVPPKPSYRPEVGVYLGNRLAAQTMPVHTLHERQGQAPGMLAPDANHPGDAAAWARVMGSTSHRNAAGGLHAADTGYVIHAGSDVLRFSDGGDGSVRIGVMGLYGNTATRADNGRIGARGNVDGYQGGLYGTWYGHPDILSGPYADAWLLFGTQNNRVMGDGLPSESYRSHTATGSLEAGYSFLVHDRNGTRLYVEPQGQLVLQNYRAGTRTEATGTVVSNQSENSLTTRLGVRVHGDVRGKDDVTRYRPFAEFNWWHGPATQSIQFNGDLVRDSLPANRYEFKAGAQGNLTKRTSVWGSAGVETGSGGYLGGKAQVGVKYNW